MTTQDTEALASILPALGYLPTPYASDRYRVFQHPDKAKRYFLGHDGSLRLGLSVSNSKPADALIPQLRERAALQPLQQGQEQPAGDQGQQQQEREQAPRQEEPDQTEPAEETPQPVAQPASHGPQPVTKQQVLIDLLTRPEGATMEQMMHETGWQAHSVRGVISGALKKKLRLDIVSDKSNG